MPLTVVAVEQGDDEKPIVLVVASIACMGLPVLIIRGSVADYELGDFAVRVTPAPCGCCEVRVDGHPHIVALVPAEYQAATSWDAEHVELLDGATVPAHAALIPLMRASSNGVRLIGDQPIGPGVRSV